MFPSFQSNLDCRPLWRYWSISHMKDFPDPYEWEDSSFDNPASPSSPVSPKGLCSKKCNPSRRRTHLVPAKAASQPLWAFLVLPPLPSGWLHGKSLVDIPRLPRRCVSLQIRTSFSSYHAWPGFFKRACMPDRTSSKNIFIHLIGMRWKLFVV